jgi:hypothetical protein
MCRITRVRFGLFFFMGWLGNAGWGQQVPGVVLLM